MSKLPSPILSQLENLAEEVARREGVQLYDLEFVGQGRQRILRIFIDSEKGVSIDDCANVSRGLNVLLDVEDLIPDGAYELEVSSPGLERKLTRTRHFESAIGKTVRVKTTEAVPLPKEAQFKSPPQIKTLEGELISVNEAELVLKKDEMNWDVPREIIHKATTVFVDTSSKHLKQKKKKKKK